MATVGVLLGVAVGKGVDVMVGVLVGLLVIEAEGITSAVEVSVPVASPPSKPPKPSPLARIKETDTTARQSTSKPPPANQTQIGNRRFLVDSWPVDEGIGVLVGVAVPGGWATPVGAAAKVSVVDLLTGVVAGGGSGALTGCLFARRDRSLASPAPVAYRSSGFFAIAL